MRQFIVNTYRLGIKELWSLWRDPAMVLLIVFLFVGGVYSSSTASPESLNNAPIAVVDEDNSPLSQRLISALYPPYFKPPVLINWAQMDVGMDQGKYAFTLVIPHNFQQDLLANKSPQMQLNVDATRMSMAFAGSGYLQQILQDEINEFAQGVRASQAPPVDLVLRARFNPNLDPAWFGSLATLINYIAMLSLLLTGAALIREREHGTIEHLLVMPVTPAQIMTSKVWSMSLVVLLAAWLSVRMVVQNWLAVPIAGSLPLFFTGAALCLFATTSMGIFMATVARNMPQFAMLMILVFMPLQMLSGGISPRDSMPELVQHIMLAAPTTHFVQLGRAILFRGAGLADVWPQFAALTLIGAVLFAISLRRFRSTIAQMA